jgi:hypothetical protein
MKISTTHKRFADHLDDQIALEYPARFLGPNWKNVLNFWIYLDTLSGEEFRLIFDRYWALDEDARVSAINNAHKAAEATIDIHYTYTTRGAALTLAPAYASLELIGSHKLESLNFLPLFLNQ